MATAIAAEETASCVTQAVQLSQRDRAMLRVIEYFATSLKVTRIRNDALK